MNHIKIYELNQQSPFVDLNVTDLNDLPISYKEVEQPKEQFYKDDVVKELKQLYKDRGHLLKTIIKMYKNISTTIKKQLWEKTERDISNDLANTKISLDMDNIIKNSYKEMVNAQNDQKQLHKKMEMLPYIINFCYIYYIHSFDDTAPFHKLPVTIFKYRMIINTLHAYGNDKYENINAIFEQIILQPLICDMCQSPPFYMRTELSDGDIKEKFSIIIIPILKDLLNSLLKLPQPKSVKIAITDEKIKISLPEPRIDNVDCSK
jgi:hypothetical protein